MYVCLHIFAYFLSLTDIIFHKMFQHLFLTGLTVIFHAWVEFSSYLTSSFLCFSFLRRTISSSDHISNHSSWSLIPLLFQAYIAALHVASPIFLYPSLLLLYFFPLETCFMKFRIKGLWKLKQSRAFESYHIFILPLSINHLTWILKSGLINPSPKLNVCCVFFPSFAFELSFWL